jgi:CHRD domain
MQITARHILMIMAFLACGWTTASYADPVSFSVALSGAEQVPPVQTAGSGIAELTYDPATQTIKWTITYSGLSGTATMVHLHGPASRGEKGGVMLWLSKQGNTAESPISGQAVLTPEQSEQFSAGRLYVNVHTQANPGGELRGQVMLPAK